jgi:hypothetical protein
LAGLLVLIVFAWTAVAMTTGGASTPRPSLTPSLIAQTMVVAGEGDRVAGGGERDHGRGDGRDLR